MPLSTPSRRRDGDPAAGGGPAVGRSDSARADDLRTDDPRPAHTIAARTAAHPAGDAPTGPVGRLAARTAALLTGRRSAWVMLGVMIALLLAMAGGLRGAGPVAGMDALPASSESARAAAIADTLEGSRYQPVFAVVTRADGSALTAEDAAAVETLRADLAEVSGREAIGPMPAEDGEADLVMTTVDSEAEADSLDAMITDLRAAADGAVPRS